MTTEERPPESATRIRPSAALARELSAQMLTTRQAKALRQEIRSALKAKGLGALDVILYLDYKGRRPPPPPFDVVRVMQMFASSDAKAFALEIERVLAERRVAKGKATP